MNGKDPLRILCFGDSNTWGTIGYWENSPLPTSRFDRAHRWTGVLQAELGPDFEIIEEGLGGRSTIYSKPGFEWKSGESYLVPCMHSHRPIDLIVIMLGTNDLQISKTIAEEDLPAGISRLVDLVQAYPNTGRESVTPKILLLPPIEVRPSAPGGRTEVFDKFRREIGQRLSLLMPEVYAQVAREKGCFFFNTQSVAQPGRADGVHMDPASHIRLGKSLAAYIREAVFPPTPQLFDWEGCRTRLYMRFEKQMRSAQGMAVHDDRAYILYDSGHCAVHALNDRSEKPLDFFPLGSANEGTPSREYRNHSNQAMFGTLHHAGNPLPLLYVTIGSGTGADEDGFYYRCAVENIVRTTDADGAERHRAETLQVISYKPDGIEHTPFLPPCWGCPAFFADTENGHLYILSARWRTIRGCVPEGEQNAIVITKFSLPPLSAGPKVCLTPADILDQFVVPADIQFTQGGTLSDGKIYYTFGCPKAGYPNELMVFDLAQKKAIARVRGLDEALHEEELESCAFYCGDLLLNTCDGGIYTLGALPQQSGC